ncbi:MAG: YbhB/YbcL family Raf kinase inhibitor-like protein [Candidatus Obscuribacterales bacterium]|nr:YbhB/YbcL family Raf kinase inhibitor-like protein [Candidatus Obscuribacterales bacterium]
MPNKIKQTISLVPTLTIAAIASICILNLTACHKSNTAENVTPLEKNPPAATVPAPQSIVVNSPDLTNGETITKKFTADGANLSPAINWSVAPEKTASFALIADDPDAPGGDWIHWVIYDIPASQNGLPPSFSKKSVLPNQTKQGKNSFRKTGYGGPQPPPGKLHHYYFTVYALDNRGLPDDLDADGLIKAMQGHIVGSGKLMGTYQR